MKFEVKREAKNAVAWVKKYFDAQPHAQAAVLGISGGKDSACCAAIICKAIGADRLIGVSLPNGDQADIEDARLVAKTFGFKLYEVNINSAYSRLHDNIERAGITLSNQATINMLPRFRMTTLYAISGNFHGRVCGTGNYSEDALGYFTKYGDGGVDFNPIQYFVTDEVSAIGEYLGVPHEIAYKTPSDGICGVPDEVNLGIQYKDINLYLRGQADQVNPDIVKKIEDKIAYNKHKVSPVPCYKPRFVKIKLF
jgi:NAD+ synthase